MSDNLYPSSSFNNLAPSYSEGTPLNVAVALPRAEEMKPVLVEPDIATSADSYQNISVPTYYAAVPTPSSSAGSFYAPVVTITKSGSRCRQVFHFLCVGVCSVVALTFLAMIITTAVIPQAVDDTVPYGLTVRNLYRQTTLNVGTSNNTYDYQKFLRIGIQDIPSAGDFDTISVCSNSNLNVDSVGRTGLFPIGLNGGLSSYSSLEDDLNVVTIPHCITGKVATFTVCSETGPYLWISATNTDYNDVNASFLLYQDTCNSGCYCTNELYHYGIIAGIVVISVFALFLLAAVCCVCGCCCCCISARKKESSTTSYMPIA